MPGVGTKRSAKGDTMRNYLLLVALLATSNAFAWSLDARVSSKPVCDRIDTAPAKSALPANPVIPAHPDSVIARPDDSTPAVVGASPNVTATTNALTTPANKSGGAGSGRARNPPRWQSFLPGMFK